MDIWPLVIAVTFAFVVVYLVTESAQNYLYENVVDGLWWRALVSAVLLGFLMAWFPLSIDNLFEQSMWPLLAQATLWFLVFWLLCRYQLGHGLALGILMYVISAWFFSMAASSFASWMSGAGAG